MGFDDAIMASLHAACEQARERADVARTEWLLAKSALEDAEGRYQLLQHAYDSLDDLRANRLPEVHVK